MARPKKDAAEKASKIIRVRFTESDYEAVKCRAAKSGKRLSAYVRQSALGAKVFPIVDISALKALRLQLHYDGNNLNQLTRALNKIVGSNAKNNDKRDAIADALSRYESEFVSRKKTIAAIDDLLGRLGDR